MRRRRSRRRRRRRRRRMMMMPLLPPLSSRTDFSLHICSSSFTVSVQTITKLHIFLSLSHFLLKAE
jgi:hypothetical protein